MAARAGGLYTVMWVEGGFAYATRFDDAGLPADAAPLQLGPSGDPPVAFGSSAPALLAASASPSGRAICVYDRVRTGARYGGVPRVYARFVEAPAG
jgi:hypothetical protein